MRGATRRARRSELHLRPKLGIALVLLYDFLSASKEVYAARLVQNIDPFALAAVSFLLAAAFYHGVCLWGGADVRPRLAPVDHRYDWLMLNITTVGAWLGFFYSIRFLEPAIVSTIVVGAGPSLALVADRLLRPAEHFRATDVVSSLGILVTSTYLVTVSAKGLSAVGVIETTDLIAGTGAALVSSIFVATTSVYSKRLSEAGVGPSRIMAHRFYLLVPISALLATWRDGWHGIIAAASEILLITGFGVILSLYALQAGLRYCRPVLVMILLAVAPAMTLALQSLDSRLMLSPQSLVGVLAICAWAGIAAIGRGRSTG